MKIGILSDTHDHMDNTKKAVAILNERGVERVLHAGDYVAPFIINELAALKAPLDGVYGNNDGERVGLQARITQIGNISLEPLFLEIVGKQIALMHEPSHCERLASSGAYDLVIYGHTHKVDMRKEGKTLVVNPGEVCGWLSGKATFMIVDLDSMEAEVITL